jgi:hypothetical protein
MNYYFIMIDFFFTFAIQIYKIKYFCYVIVIIITIIHGFVLIRQKLITIFV